MLINCLLSLCTMVHTCVTACKDTKVAGLSPSASLTFASPKSFLTIFIRKKRHRSGNIGVIVVEKIGGNIGVLFYDI